MGPGELTEHAERNRAHWTGLATSYAEAARRAWQREPNWGCWGSPDSELHLLDDVSGKHVLELGCGTAYISSWLARQGARVVGLDVTPAQLETARRMQAEFGIEFELVEASAESVPLPDASFDLVVSEFGASIWCDPYLWVPEAARVLRPGGRLVFLVNGVISMLCYPDEPGPAGTELLRPYFGMHRVEWSFEDSVEFHLPHGDWIRLLRSNGLDVLDLVELQAPEGAPDPTFDYATTEWARKWPAEEIWVARKRS
jgi:SAM-dependent methyltransferase